MVTLACFLASSACIYYWYVLRPLHALMLPVLVRMLLLLLLLLPYNITAAAAAPAVAAAVPAKGARIPG
jgi:hypothetical protein